MKGAALALELGVLVALVVTEVVSVTFREKSVHGAYVPIAIATCAACRRRGWRTSSTRPQTHRARAASSGACDPATWLLMRPMGRAYEAATAPSSAAAISRSFAR